MLISVELEKFGTTLPAEEKHQDPPLVEVGGHSEIRGREEEFDDVLRVLRDARASGLAVRIRIEGPTGIGRGAFAVECLRAARGLGLHTQGPVRCPGRAHRLPALVGLCPACRGDGPWTRVGDLGRAHRASPDVGICSASGRVWLRAYPEGPAVTRAHPQERVHPVRLGSLTRASVLQLAEDILGATPGETLTACLERAGGHPALVGELLLGLREERSLVYRGGRADICVDRLPARVHAWVDGVLRSVRIPVDEFLAACASMGHEFEYLEPVRRAMDLPGHQIEEMSRVAVELGILRRGSTFRFQSPIMHEIFWSNIPRRFPSFIRLASRATPSPHLCASPETGLSLTAQEKRLVLLASEGFTNQQIAHRLKISQHTVNYHLKKLFKKYGVNSRVRLVRTALKDTALGHMHDGHR
ncbi:helix-turn-helix transcriptional regulator [Nocardiopsis lambiniae]|uniref:Helix-turn-helix transcriptional regulator n=1 Tax=Nocardiopsis lambiniae TaxID=3075539 RepID=A0ABU2MDG7_9ACTN|nr:helix-turn-helix transcriptional regulator [Nocardiopsis sp. DSM 44743]MDT0330170.1 helix-turn-helix transcriptional regulator [Nocardiopsis sp. DSM 44743]